MKWSLLIAAAATVAACGNVVVNPPPGGDAGGEGGAMASSTTSSGGGTTSSSTGSTTSSATTASSSSSSASSSSGSPVCTSPWAVGVSSDATSAYGSVVGVGANGHVVVAGSFNETIDIGGTTLVAQGLEPNVFVAAFDCAGDPLWAKRFGDPPTMSGQADFVYALQIASDGAIVLTGLFQGTIDFGNGPLTAQGSADGFVAKLDADGNEVFALRFGAAGGGSAGTGVAVDASGNVYVGGSLGGQQDFGTGAIGTAGVSSVFVLELDPNGNALWAKAFGQGGRGPSLALDASGNIALAGGELASGLDFGGGPLPAGSVYAAELTATGGFVWSKSWGSDGKLTPVSAIEVGPSGEVVFTGSYNDTSLDFGGGALPSPGTGRAAFVTKLTSAGAYVFTSVSAMTGSALNSGTAVSVDATGNVHVLGSFIGTIDFGGGPVMSSSPSTFLAQLTGTGTLTSLATYGQASAVTGNGLAFDASGAPVITGAYVGSPDFGTGPLPNEASPDEGIFVARLAP